MTKQLALPLHASGFTDLPQQILIAAFKKEQVLEVYGNLQGKWTFIKSYPFMASSGTIGPKLREGDLQIPEGIYGVEYLNPNSAYYLSMKVSYPNEYDKAQAKKENRTNLGNDIFIHGKNVTIGCIPIGDEAIEELFYLVAKSDLAATKIIISPQDFRKDASFPVVEQIDWTADLYQNIALALNELK